MVSGLEHMSHKEMLRGMGLGSLERSKISLNLDEVE